MELDLKLIRTDGGTQARAGLDRATVAEYTEALVGENDYWPFPYVVVYHDGSDHWLADGFHRVAAANQAGRDHVLADIRQGTRREAVLHAAGANAEHGLRRTPEDKRRAVLHLLEDQEWRMWSDREIARTCRVSPTFVGKLRSENGLTVHVDSEEPEQRTYTTKHGTTAVMNTANIGGQAQEFKYALVWELQTKIGDWLRERYGGENEGSLVGLDRLNTQQSRHPAWSQLVEAMPTPHREEDLLLALEGLLNIWQGRAAERRKQAEAPSYTPVWDLEQRVRTWLSSDDVAIMGPADPLTNLANIKERRVGWGVAWNSLKAALYVDEIAYRESDLRQACNNVLSQSRAKEPVRNEEQTAVSDPDPDAIKAGLHRALHTFQDAKGKWSERRSVGLTDDELKKAIASEFGIAGGSSGPGRTPISYKGGADPAFWYNAHGGSREKPTLRGAALLRVAREVLDIPYPAENGIQSVPNRQVYAAVKQLRERGYNVEQLAVDGWSIDGILVDDAGVWRFLDDVLDEEQEALSTPGTPAALDAIDEELAESVAEMLAEPVEEVDENQQRLFDLKLIEGQLALMVINSKPPMVWAYNRAWKAVLECIEEFKKEIPS